MLNDFNRRLELSEGFETNYVRLLYYDLSKGFSSVYKTYNYTRFCTILKGEKKITLDNNKTVSYGKSNYLLLPPYTEVQMEAIVDTKALIFEFNDNLIDDVVSKIDLDKAILGTGIQDLNYYVGHNKWFIREEILNVLEVSKQSNKNREFLIDLYVQRLIFDLIQDKATHPILRSDTNNPINIALRYMHTNIHGVINIGELAAELYMSESNFSHLFKKMIGMTPGQYIKDKKMELASTYLQTENVTNVAYSLGYMNISYFIKIFKEKYTLTPKQYKLKHYA